MGLFDMVDSFLNPQEGYKKGQQQLDKYYNQSKNLFDQGQSYLQPYNQFGQNAYGNLSSAMQKLLDPAALEGEWIKGYNESPSAINATELAKQEGLDAASSMGLLGSNTALNALQGGASKIALNDRENYLDNLMQKYLAGTGIASNIFNTGAGAASTMSGNAMNMANNAMTMGGDSAQMVYGEKNAPGDLFGKLLGTGIGAGANYATGGLSGLAKYMMPNSGGWSIGG